MGFDLCNCKSRVKMSTIGHACVMEVSFESNYQFSELDRLYRVKRFNSAYVEGLDDAQEFIRVDTALWR